MRTYTVEEVRDAIVEEILGYEVDELVDPEVFTAAAIERLKSTPQPQGDASPEGSGGGYGIAKDFDHTQPPPPVAPDSYGSVTAMSTPRAHEPAPTADTSLHDRVEFALRDAGFDYDEASRIATLTDEPAPTADGGCAHEWVNVAAGSPQRCAKCDEAKPAPTADGGAVAWETRYPGEWWSSCNKGWYETVLAERPSDARALYARPSPAPDVARLVELAEDFTAKGHHSCAADLRAILTQPEGATNGQ